MNGTAGTPLEEGVRSRPTTASVLAAGWRRLTSLSGTLLQPREPRRLRMLESVSLGEKRFACLLEVDGESILVGSSPTGIVLLKQLSEGAEARAAATSREGETARETGPPRAFPSRTDTLPTQSRRDIRVAEQPGATAAARIGKPVMGACFDGPSCSVSLSPTAAPVQPTVFGTERKHAFRMAGLLIATMLLLPTLARAAPAPAPTAAPASAPAPAPAATAPAPDAKPGGPGISLTGLGSSSAPWTIVVLLTFLTLIPSLMICMTPFARLLVVFHFLRQALGLQTTPSNQTLIGLSLILTFFLMEPVGKQIYNESFIPLQNGQITALEAVSRGSDPMRHFMAHYVREKDAALFLEIAHAPRPASMNDVSMRVLLPAYIVSELKAGFQIGAVLFLPFLVVDIVIASITTSVGMMQLPPVVISTPLKLMLFLMVDGWHLLISALVRSFN
ncbi:MAG: flagellar type III secretion system pore protein FliP [Janthinobacterium lividum]